MNLILEKSSRAKYYSYLDTIFHHLPELHEYHWLITDLKLNNYPDDRLKSESIVMDGKELNAYLKRYKVQFIWAVLSAFRTPVFAIPKELPFADGNNSFWHGSPRPQAPGAELEIVCWEARALCLSDSLRIWHSDSGKSSLTFKTSMRKTNKALSTRCKESRETGVKFMD